MNWDVVDFADCLDYTASYDFLDFMNVQDFKDVLDVLEVLDCWKMRNEKCENRHDK